MGLGMMCVSSRDSCLENCSQARHFYMGLGLMQYTFFHLLEKIVSESKLSEDILLFSSFKGDRICESLKIEPITQV